MLKEHLCNIKKIFQMSILDLKKVYKGAALGWIWVIAKPSVTIFMYWFLFDIGLRIGKDVNNHPYYIWLITGLIPWFYISNIINTLPNTYRKYSYLVNKVKFPTSIIPTFVSLSNFIVHIILTLIVMIIYLVTMKNLNINFVSLIFYMTFMFIFMSVIANILALISSLSKDIANLIKTLQPPLLYLSPVLWNLDTINIEFIKNIQLSNPIAYFVNGYRNAFINNTYFFEDMTGLIIMVLLLIILIFLNFMLYKKIHKAMPDYL